MKKKILSVLLAVCCLFSAGCTDDTTSQQVSTPDTSVTSASSQTEPAPEVTTTTAAPAPEEPEPLPFNQGTALELILSGNAEDIYVIDADCYVLTENTVIYVRNGSYVRGDLGVCVESILDEVCTVTGLPAAAKYGTTDVQYILPAYGYSEDSFIGVNGDGELLNVVISPLEDGITPWSERNFILLDDGDPYFANETPEGMFQLLTGVVLRNNGVSLGNTLDVGIELLCAEKLLEQHGCHTWSWVQFYKPFDFDDSCIRSGADGFDHMFMNGGGAHSVYGFVFCSFLEDTYGEDIFVKLLNKATAEGFDAAYESVNEDAALAADTQQMRDIIISVTELDVFEKFAQWYGSDWSGKVQEWKDYMTSIGEDVSFL